MPSSCFASGRPASRLPVVLMHQFDSGVAQSLAGVPQWEPPPPTGTKSNSMPAVLILTAPLRPSSTDRVHTKVADFGDRAEHVGWHGVGQRRAGRIVEEVAQQERPAVPLDAATVHHVPDKRARRDVHFVA